MHCLVKSSRNWLCLADVGLLWVSSRNAMMIMLFSFAFVAFLLSVLGKTEGALSNTRSAGGKTG